MYAVDDIRMWICLLCVYIHIRLYNNTDTCILYTIIATCAQAWVCVYTSWSPVPPSRHPSCW